MPTNTTITNDLLTVTQTIYSPSIEPPELYH